MLEQLRASLTRTRKSVFGRIVTLLGAGEIDDETWEELEALLIQADVGVETTSVVVDRLRHRVSQQGIVHTDQLVDALGGG